MPVDFVVGTSMGAIVGGLSLSLWGLGPTAAEIEERIARLDWAQAFADKPPREMLAFRRRQDDDGLFMRPRHRPATRQGDPAARPRPGPAPRAAAARHDPPRRHRRQLDLLPVPFRAVATDIVSGEEVVIGSGDLAPVLRARMAVPGVFAPVTRGDRLLIDGGVANNLPVDVARRAGAEIIVAVDVSARPVTRQELGLGGGDRRPDADHPDAPTSLPELASLGAATSPSCPSFGELRSTHFAAAADAIALGEAGARGCSDALAPLAVSPAAGPPGRRARRSAAPRRRSSRTLLAPPTTPGSTPPCCRAA